MPAPPPAAADSKTTDRYRTLAVVAAIVAVIALPVGVSVGMSWVDMPWAQKTSAPAPQWVAVPTVRATTGDGTAVKMRVAVDVTDGATRDAIQRQTQQVVLLLETSISAHATQDLVGVRGIETLGADMDFRLNRWLQAEGVPPARQVVVQDLLLNPP